LIQHKYTELFILKSCFSAEACGIPFRKIRSGFGRLSCNWNFLKLFVLFIFFSAGIFQNASAQFKGGNGDGSAWIISSACTQLNIYGGGINQGGSAYFGVVGLSCPASACAFSLSASSTNVSCPSNSDGSASASVKGKSAPYSYLWSGGQTTATATGLATGTYTVTVTDNNGCSLTATATVSAIAGSSAQCGDKFKGGGYDGNAIAVSAPCTALNKFAGGFYDGNSQNEISCPPGLNKFAGGAYDGYAQNSISCPPELNRFAGGAYDGSTRADSSCAAPMNIFAGGAFDGNTRTEISCSVPVNIYAGGMRDGNAAYFGVVGLGCPAIDCAFSFSFNQTNASCTGAADASITAVVNGNSAPYTFLWSNAQTTAAISGLTAGTYTVTVTDANNCTKTQSASVTEPSGTVCSPKFNGGSYDGIASAIISNCAAANKYSGGSYDGIAYASLSGCTSFNKFLGGAYDGFASASVSNCTSLNVFRGGSYDGYAAAGKFCPPCIFQIICPANIIASTDPGNCNAVVNYTATVTGGCDGITVSSTHPSGSTFPVGATQVTLTATDAFGNSETCSFNITVNDNEKPGIVCPADVTVNNDADSCNACAVALGTPVTGDNCGVASVVNNAPACFPVGTTAVQWTVTDVNGNSSVCIQNVTVTDNQNPAISCPSDVNSSTDTGTCIACSVILGTPVTGDNCGVASVVNNAPACFPVGTTAVQWTVTDVNGNSATCNQNVIITDNENPTITCPSDINADTDAGTCTACSVVLGTPVTGDNCGVASVVNNAPACFPVGTTVVQWTVTDSSGNTATCNQNVTITDNENPTITCPADISVNADAGSCSACAVVPGTPVTGDNCGVASVSNNAPACFPLGTTVVQWMVTDVNGNTATCNQNVTVSPNAIFLSETHQNVTCSGSGNGSIDLTVSGGAAPYTFNWSNGATTEDLSGLSAGIYTVTVTDDCGTTSSLSVTITEDVLSITGAVTHVTGCSGNSNGAIDISVSGGAAPITYLWNDGNTNEDRTGIAAGTYTVTVSDNNACVDSASFVVNQPAVTIRYSYYVNHNAPYCGPAELNAGAAGIAAAGSSPPLSYQWYDSTNAPVPNANGGNTQNIFNMQSGTYHVVITDNNGCTVTQFITIQ